MLGAVVYAAEVKASFFHDLASKEPAFRLSNYGSAERDRDRKIAELVSIVETTNDRIEADDTLELAINLLGIYRAKEAVPTLAKRLMFLPLSRIHSLERVPSEMYYPAARALVNIGEPSDVVYTMIRKIAASESAKERQEAAWVIMEIRGAKVAVWSLRAARKDATEPIERQRLQTAADFIQHYKPKLAYPE